MHWGRVTFVLFCLGAPAAACGGSSSSDSTGGASSGGAAAGGAGGNGGVTTGGGSGGVTTGGGSGGVVTGGASGSGGFVITGGSGGGEPDGFLSDVVLADAAPFDCDGCACDGSTHYCLHVAAGAKTPPLPDAAACSDAGTSCIPLPDGCGSTPSCSCIPPKYGGACYCSDVGGGLLVFCALP